MLGLEKPYGSTQWAGCDRCYYSILVQIVKKAIDTILVLCYNGNTRY
jgi:hypothetical protein